jgi:endonuclease VIII
VPEGDTVLRTAQRLDQALTGDVLIRGELRWPGLGDANLRGREVLGTRAYGKHILTRLGPETAGAQRFPTTSAGPLTLHSHLKMEGRWTIEQPDYRVVSDGVRVRAVLGTPRWIAVANWLGMLDLVPTEQESELIGHLGPDIMVDEFPDVGLPEAVRRLSQTPQREIGAALLDQTTVAGIGTMYMAEALFLQHVSPWTPVGEVDLPALLLRARKLLLHGATQAIPSTTGNPRKGMDKWVHARSGVPCQRCGTIIRVAQIGPDTRQRPAFWCPRCQPGPAPAGAAPRGPLGSNPKIREFRRPTGYR